MLLLICCCERNLRFLPYTLVCSVLIPRLQNQRILRFNFVSGYIGLYKWCFTLSTSPGVG